MGVTLNRQHSVIVVNGRPRAGKDTCVEIMTSLLSQDGYSTSSFSSIDPVRDMLNGAGINLSKKTNDDRDLMASVGQALEKHSEWRTNQCAERARWFAQLNGDVQTVMFVHMRERELIERLKTKLPGHSFYKVLVENPRVPMVTSNSSDADVYGVTYDYTIVNDGSLDQLTYSCAAALTKLNY